MQPRQNLGFIYWFKQPFFLPEKRMTLLLSLTHEYIYNTDAYLHVDDKEETYECCLHVDAESA